MDDKPIKLNDKRFLVSERHLPSPTNTGINRALELSPGGVTVLTVTNTNRIDSGRYKVVISNDLGQTSSSCQVKVLGKKLYFKNLIFILFKNN